MCTFPAPPPRHCFLVIIFLAIIFFLSLQPVVSFSLLSHYTLFTLTSLSRFISSYSFNFFDIYIILENAKYSHQMLNRLQIQLSSVDAAWHSPSRRA